ncbi:MAG: ribonuclease HII [Ruminococcaceae bacterium]|nr:ribonuclease HII [Oscillospiraceae bacterium]
MLTWEIENSFCTPELQVLCGCDEAGRGPLAGPVYAAAVILPKGLVIEGLDDSKKLSPKKRDLLYDRIKEQAPAYAIARAEVEEIEELNILECALLAMRRAMEALEIRPDAALIDGNIARGFSVPAFPVIGGDAKCPSIAAASVLAKVERDRDCLALDKLYPQYGFAVHKGYATKAHREAILQYGPCPAHRMSFLKKLLGKCE